jgi:hypothetical protein
MSNKRSGRAPVVFDDAAFAEALRRVSNAGETVAVATRRDFEAQAAQRVPVEVLLACEEEGAPRGLDPE